MAVPRRDEGGPPAGVEDEVGDQSDQPEQAPGEARAEEPDGNGEAGDQEHARPHAEIAEMLGALPHLGRLPAARLRRAPESGSEGVNQPVLIVSCHDIAVRVSVAWRIWPP